MTNQSNRDELLQTAKLIRDTIALRGESNALMELIGARPNPFRKMCYVASALLYKLHNGEGMTLYKKRDYAGEYHWWIRTDDGETIDITAEQYSIEGKEIPSSSYDGAEVGEIMWYPSYKDRMNTLEKELLEHIKSLK